ncbi:MAG: altronate dehydratase, partial [Saprospiraceae bacterium]|nr:altronate dehydratase [Saprospiraceae bacterium]
MRPRVLQIHPLDNAIVALEDLFKGETIHLNGQSWTLADDVQAKHKFAAEALQPGDAVRMYGVLVGKAQSEVPIGGLLSTANLRHATLGYSLQTNTKTAWNGPDVRAWTQRTFQGYHRADGSVGTANYWLVIPLVFCENRNVDVLREALVTDLGYDKKHNYRAQTQQLIQLYSAGKSVSEILEADLITQPKAASQRLFSNIDGVKFLTHEGGCGGIRQDAQSLCGLLAGYITHPNVAGATVLSLGCQNAQVSMLMEEIGKRDTHFQKPLVVLEQQKIGMESDLIGTALKQTFTGLVEANQLERRPAPLSKLCVGLECGGSDGFSGLSANPALGHLSDMLVALGGSVILSEFPELCGVEQELCDRCAEPAIAQRFAELMTTYNERAKSAGSGFDMNPSPGNIRDGLITDAIKSAGAAKKGGSSPIVAVLDY